MAQSKSTGTQNRQSANEMDSSDTKKSTQKDKGGKSSVSQSKTGADKSTSKKQSKR